MKNEISDVCLVTYTNSNCHDVLLVHVGQLNKFASSIKSYILTDKIPSFETKEHEIILYNNEDPYYKQWISSIENLPNDYIIYLQEDFFLYDNVDVYELLRCKKFLDNSDYSFVRFSKFDLRKGVHDSNFSLKDFPDKEISKRIYDAYTLDKDCFSFMMQATLWKKKDFISLYSHVKSKKWFENVEWDKGIRDLNIKGAFHHDETKQLGKFHWESKLWPHICTAVGKGKWSLSHHKNLIHILNEYKVNTSLRGER
jgi:hypothetical protein